MDEDKRTFEFPGGLHNHPVVAAVDDRTFPSGTLCMNQEATASLPHIDEGPQEIKLLLRYRPEKQSLNFVILNPVNVEESLRELLKMEDFGQPAQTIKINGILNHRCKITGVMTDVDSEVLKGLLNTGWEF